MREQIYTLHHLLNWREVTRDIAPPIRLGIFGDPIGHSRSPQMQNAALRQCGIEMQYVRFHIRSNELAEALRLARQHDFVGLNLTAPHKIAAVDLMSELDVEAQQIGGINTVRFGDGKVFGFNTDAIGFARAIREDFGLELKSVSVLILGGGGASRAVAHSSAQAKGRQIWSRREQTREQLRDLSSRADLIVNATSVGLDEDDPPLLTRDAFRAQQFVYDAIYDPPRTRLLDEAAAAGARIANGRSMLLHQGAAAFEIWFGRRAAPLEIMRASI